MKVAPGDRLECPSVPSVRDSEPVDKPFPWGGVLFSLQVWVLAGAWGDQASSPRVPGSGGLFSHYEQELKCKEPAM